MEDFNQLAKHWDEAAYRLERAQVIAKQMRARFDLSAVQNAMEYGCGTGLVSFELQKDLRRITLADSAPGMLAVLAQKIAASGLSHLVPLQFDVLQDSLPEEPFDLVYHSMVLHHIPDTNGALQGFYELLAPGGRLVMVDLDEEDGSFHRHQPQFQVHNGFVRETLTRQLAQAGFVNVQFWPCYEMRRLVEGEEKVFTLFMVSALRM